MRIGIIGTGRIGATLARLWTSHEVLVSSRNPASLAPLVAELGDRARAGTPLDAARFGDVVLLAVPFAAPAVFDHQTKAALRGKIVIDAGNPFAGRDGDVASDVANGGRGSGCWTADRLPGTIVVKAFNTVYFERMRNREGVGVPLASDDPEARAKVAELVRDAGMEPVEVGPLATAHAFDPGTPVWNSGQTAEQLRESLGLD